MPFNIDFYGVDFEGRRHQITQELGVGIRRKEITSVSIPWVFKKSHEEKRLPVFVGSISALSFKGGNFDVKEGSTIHVTINDNGILNLREFFY